MIFDIGRIDALLETITWPHILCGDFNAHRTLWGGRCTDTRGSVLKSIIGIFNRSFLNDGSATFHRGNSSVLDLTFLSGEQYQIFRWTTDHKSRGSDHMPLLIFCNNFTECKTANALPATIWEKKFRTCKRVHYCYHHGRKTRTNNNKRNCLAKSTLRTKMPINTNKIDAEYERLQAIRRRAEKKARRTRALEDRQTKRRA